MSRHEYRLLASGAFVLSAAAAGASSLASASTGGPLTVGLDDNGQLADRPASCSSSSGSWWRNGLRSGRRRAWRWAMGLTVASLAVLVAVGVALAVDGQPGWPLVTYTALLTCAQLAVLVLGRRAFRNPTPAAGAADGGLLPLHARARTSAAGRRPCSGPTAAVNRLAWMTTWPENRWFGAVPSRMQERGRSRAPARVALGLCDPVGSSEGRSGRSCFGEFANAVHGAGPGALPLHRDLGDLGDPRRAPRAGTRSRWRRRRGSKLPYPRVPARKSWQDVRTAMNQAAKPGGPLSIGPLPQTCRVGSRCR